MVIYNSWSLLLKTGAWSNNGNRGLDKLAHRVNHHSEYRQFKDVFSFLIFTWWEIGHRSCLCAPMGRCDMGTMRRNISRHSCNTSIPASWVVWSGRVYYFGAVSQCLEHRASGDWDKTSWRITVSHTILSRELCVFFSFFLITGCSIEVW